MRDVLKEKDASLDDARLKIKRLQNYFFARGEIPETASVLSTLYLAKLRRIFVHMQGGFSTA